MTTTGTLSELSPIQVKKAYRAALLAHHPDKQSGNNIGPNSAQEVFDIDLISKAYTTLSDPDLRSEYNKWLRKCGSVLGGSGTTGEIVDLDDLQMKETLVDGEETCEWFKSCRCGEEQGYKITEQNLIDNGNSTEIIVQCIGCSLWIKVVYESVEDGI
ncbi:hypothetical protein NADFUDRAFT_24955 [Nadsonia fulvescens var. elongata DSM 6958]|uniref:Diphthamide biosynthesis protein 4 n=1 Tax=Nadsonia fulvescens var. elongata DSM 6958 TaxID=857566 RepID=A0A1E3PIE4_9ASCO|nr:hypothetical protein NADFUDRAFT_24955 [Nadsonia fulvescens var. elongata DSM 6958]